MFKHTLVPVILLFAFSACKPNTDERARDLILHYCDVTYKHYQPIDFSPAQAYYVPYQRSAKALTYHARLTALKHQKDSLHKLIAKSNKPVLLLQADSIAHAMLALDTLQQQDIKTYRPERRGWMVVHQYNQKDIGGPLVRSSTVFIVDADFKNILETYEQ